MSVVVARGIRKSFGKLEAVAGIDLDIPPGVCFGLLGPNGAGKTTTIKMIQAVSPLTSGRLEVLGEDVRTQGRSVRAKLGVVPQDDTVDPDFTVRENLLQYARYFRVPRAEAARRADEILRFMNLEETAKSRTDPLSGGMKRRLVVGRALMSDPELLILDEPTTGLDPQARHALWETIRRLRREGKTILLTTHYMDEAEMLCDELVVIDKGVILEQGKPRALIAKHCGSEAVEFVVAERQGDAEAMLDSIEKELGKAPFERLGDRILAYGDGMEKLQRRVVKACHVEESILRRATLEDVFLRLTGRALRE